MSNGRKWTDDERQKAIAWRRMGITLEEIWVASGSGSQLCGADEAGLSGPLQQAWRSGAFQRRGAASGLRYRWRDWEAGRPFHENPRVQTKAARYQLIASTSWRTAPTLFIGWQLVYSLMVRTTLAVGRLSAPEVLIVFRIISS